MEMSDEHKAALADGRKQARTVRTYLEALETRGPGRAANPETLEKRLTRIEERLGRETDVLRRLELTQAHVDTRRDLDAASSAVDLEPLESAFAVVAASYGTRKGISYAAWRAAGVPAAALKRAGIKQTRNRGRRT